ncbi:Ubiquitin-like protein 5 [Striga hermonthica]|uniref:Ubiquitin-like protein 5 n=1 Tax=Striga hermonthica TaxID=68872 RepID=A0A9N7N2R1_STRHE|nr:Ubiquitin-like protein 5 [Striga hermonthica]
MAAVHDPFLSAGARLVERAPSGGDEPDCGGRQEKRAMEGCAMIKWCTIYMDHITFKDYEVHDVMGLELYYN